MSKQAKLLKYLQKTKITTEKEYEALISRIELLIDLDPELGSAEADLLDELIFVANQYEDEHYPII